MDPVLLKLTDPLLDLSHNLLTSGFHFIKQYGQFTEFALQKCSIVAPDNLYSLDLSYNKISFDIRIDPITQKPGLFVDNGAFQCVPNIDPNDGTEHYGFFINSNLVSVNLGYNLLNDTFIHPVFVFNPNNYSVVFPERSFWEDQSISYGARQNNRFLDLVGNRFADPGANPAQSICYYSAIHDFNYLNSPVCTINPQDIDDCAVGTHQCPTDQHSFCSNGFDPLMSYTCTCDPGYTEDLNESPPNRPCIDIDECETSFPCGNGFICTNTDGGFYCTRDLTGLAVALPVVFGCLLLAILLYFLIGLLKRYLAASYLRDLPDEVAWTYQQAIMSPGSGWMKSGGFLMKELIPESDDYERACQVLKLLHFSELQTGAVYAVYNRNLVTNFTSAYRIQQQRYNDPSSKKAFFSQNTWKSEGDVANRERVYNQFEGVCKQPFFGWNQEGVCIIPCAHGTDMAIAERIAKTGFAALSSIDAGT